MQLCTDARLLLDMVAASGQPKLWELTPPEAREKVIELTRMVECEEAIGKIEDRTLPGPAGLLSYRVYTPLAASDGPSGGMVFFTAEPGCWVTSIHTTACAGVNGGRFAGCVAAQRSDGVQQLHAVPNRRRRQASFRVSCVRPGRTVSSMSFSRKAASYFWRPRLRSQTRTSMRAPKLRVAAHHRAARRECLGASQLVCVAGDKAAGFTPEAKFLPRVKIHLVCWCDLFLRHEPLRCRKTPAPAT